MTDARRYCSELLIDAYRWPDIHSPQRNYTYMEAVTRYLGESALLLPFHHCFSHNAFAVVTRMPQISFYPSLQQSLVQV